MKTPACVAPVAGAFVLLSASVVAAQPFEAAGTRAQGMGGAFVAVADDASAVYWNPGGLATGAYFSLVMDRTAGKAAPAGDERGASTSNWLLALTMPALGLSYYRLRETTITPQHVEEPGGGPGLSRIDALVTHHAGVTLVQSVLDRVAIGATLKLVRGVAGSAEVPRDEARDLLGDLNLPDTAASKFDADIGIMATGSLARAGVTVRNLLQRSFDAGDGRELTLSRQVRAGVALYLAEGVLASADLDLTRTRGPFGDVRNFALGTEARVLRRAFARAGLRLNTAGDAGRQPAFCFGAGYAVLDALLVDAQVTTGSDTALRGWGVSGRVGF